MCRQWLEDALRSTIRNVKFIFVAGHPGVSGNERADRLVGLAAISEDQPLDHDDLTRDTGRVEDFEEKLVDIDIKTGWTGRVTIGNSRNERYSRRTKKSKIYAELTPLVFVHSRTKRG